MSPFLLEEAERLGQALAEAGWSLIYGGANVGAMGRVADGALKAGGKVIGVIPDLDFAQGLVHAHLHEQVVVSTLAERKRIMLERSQAVVVFPGGLGTLDEATDALVLKQTGEMDLAIHFFSPHGFWVPFLETLDQMNEARLIHGSLEGLFQVHERVDDLVRALK